MSVRATVVAALVVCGATTRTGSHTLFKKQNLKMRGAPSPAPAAGPEASPAAAPAGPCECGFQDFCTCESALAHLNCISKTCASGECDCPSTQWSQSCGKMASICKTALDISCTPTDALCDGRFYQLSSGVVGLSIEDYNKLDENAHCGPTGKCTGHVDVKVAVHNSEEGMEMNCFLEQAPGSVQKHFCAANVSNSQAKCTLQMPSELAAGGKLEGFCRLIDPLDDGKTAHRLTNDAPFYISNHHRPVEVEAPKRKRAEAPAFQKKPSPHKSGQKSGAFGVRATVAVLMVAATALRF